VTGRIQLTQRLTGFRGIPLWQIIERGHAYAVEGGDVFFSVPSSAGYGQLSGRRLEENRAGERVEVDAEEEAPRPLRPVEGILPCGRDFALWKVCPGTAARPQGVAEPIPCQCVCATLPQEHPVQIGV